ncbi:hypothetical protein CBR_g16975 [Chara braunii]|uniref:Methyltransferase domain-containing protein n=1 Tax=Chara braunii TaxID=69332 RepID=A0A388KUG6_CHABU|nr:hypothetical protein CBR_g16975 [Chara braunii]|eukprot:GBG73632.1 hypothetical protein CBR_g16975 [Chara braunii]
MASSGEDGCGTAGIAAAAAEAAGEGGSPPPPSPGSPSDVSHWEKMAKYFDAFVSLTGHFANVALDHVAEDIQRVIEKKGEDDTCHVPVIVDVAGGTGACALEAVRRFPHARVLLTDISDAMLNVARKKIAESGIANVEVKVMDGQDLEMADGSVDALTCVFGIMFFPDRSRGWREMQRVLRPGGKAAVVTWKTPGPHVLTDEAIAKYDAEVEGKAKEEEEEGMPRGEERQGECLKKTAMDDEGRKKMLYLSSASAIADDLAAAGCHFSKVETYPSPFVWQGINEGDVDMMCSLWKKMPTIENLLTGRDIELLLAKLREVMRARLDENGHVCVPCEALLTVLTK